MRFEEEYLIRLCHPEDAPLLAPLIRTFMVEEGHQTPPEIALLTDLIQTLLTTGFSDFLLAEVKSKPVGCMQINYRLSTSFAAPYGSIEDFYVQPGIQKIEISRSLLDYACQRADGRGCAFIELDVPSNQEEPFRFYERMGFQSLARNRMRTRLPRRGCCPDPDHSEEKV